MNVTLDPGAIVNALISAITNLLSPVPANFVQWVADQTESLWDDIWSSGANLLATPFELTLNYPPAQMLGKNLAIIVYGITAIAVVLLGLRILWRSFSNTGSDISDVFNGILIGIMLAGGGTIIVGQAYALTGLASTAIGRFSFTPAFTPHELLSIGPALVVSAFTLLVMFFYGWKLMFRAAYRVVLLMFMTPFAPLAGISWAIPQIRWIGVAYFVTFGGWLAGGFLAIGAISLGVQIAINESGILTLIYGVALVQLAYDLMVILPKWGFGQLVTPRMGIPNIVSSAAGAAVGGAAGGFAGGAAGGTAGGGSAAVLGGAGAIGALPSVALGVGYD